MSITRQQAVEILDVLLSEYGGTVEYWMGQRITLITALYKQIMKRKGQEYKLKTKLMTAAVGCGFSGKLDQIDKIFKSQDEESPTEVTQEQWKSQLRQLWKQQGKDPKKFEEQYEKGNVKL